jgi:hypothetical protein
LVLAELLERLGVAQVGRAEHLLLERIVLQLVVLELPVILVLK